MLRVKVLSLKDIIKKVILFFCLVMVLYFFLLIVLKFITIESRSFAANIVEENIAIETLTKEGALNTKILQKELKLEKKIENDVIMAGGASNDKGWNNNIIENSNNVSNLGDSNLEKNINEISENIDKKYLATGNIKTWNRPKTYNVTKLSSGKIQVGNTCITNYTKYNLDMKELSNVSTFPINNETDILIFHTHTSEAYSEVGSSTNFRTTDDTLNLVSVGNVLKENLDLKKFNVLHSKIKHDTPSYNGAYKASLQTVQDLFEEKEYDIVLDVHRDALSGNLNFRPTTQINGESAAKLMFVVGTNSSGVQHDNWMENLKLALLIQNTANEMYPGLFRDLNLSKSRYNQHVCDGALILEVGATGNTLEEAKIAMKYFSNVLEALKK